MGEYSAVSQQVLNQLAAARVCLLNEEKKAQYDERLQRSLAADSGAAPAVKPVPRIVAPPRQRGALPTIQADAVANRAAKCDTFSAIPMVVRGTLALGVLVLLICWLLLGRNFHQQRQQHGETVTHADTKLNGRTIPLPPPPPPPPPPIDDPRPDHVALREDAPWLDASTDKGTAGPIVVRVVSAQVGKPRVLLRGSGREAFPREPCLLIMLELANTDPTRTVHYTGWGGPPHVAEGVSLVGSHGNRYHQRWFRSGEIEGQHRQAPIRPGQSLRDVLVFERPAKPTEYLRLTLPSSAIEQDGYLRFQIPPSQFDEEIGEKEGDEDGQRKEIKQVVKADPPSVTPRALLPAPSNSKQQELLNLLESVVDTRAPRQAEEKRALARRLTDLAGTCSDPAERFVLLRRASEVASEGGDILRMLQLVDRMAEEFEVDRLRVQAANLLEFAKRATREDEINILVFGASNVIDEALSNEHFDLAESLAVAIHQACQAPAGRAFRAEAIERREEVQQMRGWWEEVQAARKSLKSNPYDEAAHTAIARWYCSIQGDWKRALPHFAKGSEPELKALAERELNNPPGDVKTRLELANAWWDLAHADAPDRNPAWSDRAAYWYEKAWPQITSPLQKELVRNRLQAMGRPDPELPQPDSKLPQPDSELPGLFPPGERRLSDLLSEMGDIESAAGKSEETRRTESQQCSTCKGTGQVRFRCPNRSCAMGRVRDYRYQVAGVNPYTGQRIIEKVPIRVPCRECKGRRSQTCPECGGRGTQ